MGLPHAGLDNSLLPPFNVTVGAGERRTVFEIQILNEFIVEKNRSFTLSISKIYNPLRDIPITWDMVPTTVNIEDDNPDVSQLYYCYIVIILFYILK